MPTNRKEYNQTYYKEHKQQRLSYNKRPEIRVKRRANCHTAGQRAKDKVFDFYGRRCVCCGEINPSLLTLDHKEGGGKQHREDVGSTLKGYGLYRWIIRNDYPAIFQTLCWNCNCGRAKNDGVCPHHTFTEVDRKLVDQCQVFQDRLPI
jgi:hypothetical protein